MPTYRSTVPTTRDGFAQALRAEWTKLRSVRSTTWTIIAIVVLTAGLSMLAAARSDTDANEGPPFLDQVRFVHQPLAGDGTVVARVRAQEATQEWAKAGLMIKKSIVHGAPSAAVMVTPRHGVRLQGNFQTEINGSASTAPRWLKLTRFGNSIAGYESADGRTWSQIGTIHLDALPRTVEVGVFVTSPPNQHVEQEPTSTRVTPVPTIGRATFDNVSVDDVNEGTSAAGPGQPARWREDDVGPAGDTGSGRSHAGPGVAVAPAPGRDAAPGISRPAGSTVAMTGGTVTVTGSGNLGGIGIGGIEVGDDDIVMNSLVGVQIGLLAVVALSALFVTSEYRTNTIHATFTASPRRGRVFAAKAVVIGATVFVAGLVASLAAFFLSQPIQRSNGFAPPAYPPPSLSDGPVLRAVVGTALFLAVLALFSLGISVAVQRTAAAITFVIGFVVVPQIVTSVLSVEATRWVHRVTPIAGLAVQQTRPRFDTAIGPWAGFGVLCAYAAVALVLALWLLRRRVPRRLPPSTAPDAQAIPPATPAIPAIPATPTAQAAQAAGPRPQESGDT